MYGDYYETQPQSRSQQKRHVSVRLLGSLRLLNPSAPPDAAMMLLTLRNVNFSQFAVSCLNSLALDPKGDASRRLQYARTIFAAVRSRTSVGAKGNGATQAACSKRRCEPSKSTVRLSAGNRRHRRMQLRTKLWHPNGRWPRCRAHPDFRRTGGPIRVRNDQLSTNTTSMVLVKKQEFLREAAGYFDIYLVVTA